MYKVVVTTEKGNVKFFKSKTDKGIIFFQVPYSFILRHKRHPVLSNFYHGEKGAIIGSETYNRIMALERKYAKYSLAALLGAKIEYFPLDGRTKKAKKLRFFSINDLID